VPWRSLGSSLNDGGHAQPSEMQLQHFQPWMEVVIDQRHTAMLVLRVSSVRAPDDSTDKNMYVHVPSSNLA
jgi:membrane-bound lytic murein transglycosylase